MLISYCELSRNKTRSRHQGRNAHVVVESTSYFATTTMPQGNFARGFVEIATQALVSWGIAKMD
jgi:hypothetical protein